MGLVEIEAFKTLSSPAILLLGSGFDQLILSVMSLHILMLLDNSFASDQRVEKEAKSLVDAGFKVTIAATAEKGLPYTDTKHSIDILRMVGDFHKHPLRRGYRPAMEELLRKLLKLPFDVVHCHDCFMLSIGLELKRRRPETFLTYDSHELLREWRYYQEIPDLVNRTKGKIVWKYLLRRERIGCQMADLVVTTTNHLSNYIQSSYSLKQAPLPVQNIPKISGVFDDNLSLKKKLNLSETATIMVQSGNIYQTDEVFFGMLDEVLKHDNLHFVIIGNRPRFYELKELTLSIPKYSNRMHFVDYDTHVLHHQLHSADFGMLYMRTDLWKSHLLTSPNRIFEYSLCGLPFISVEQASSRQLESEYGHVLFFDGNNSSFSSAIRQMTSDLASFRQKANQAKNTLSWDQEIQPLIDRYNALASSKKD